MQQLLDGHPKRARKSLDQAVRRDPDFLPARRLLGVACDLEGDHAAALDAYLEVVRRDSTFSRLLYYHIGDVYLRAGQPRRALDYLERFRNLQGRPIGNYGLTGEQEAGTEKNILETTLDQRLLAARILSDSLNYGNASALARLGPQINTPLNDYFPFFTNDLTGLLFTRQARDGDEDLIQGKRRGPQGDYSTSRFGHFNTQQPEGMCTLVRDGETIFFTLCHEMESGGSCDIHSGVLIDGRIQHTARLPDYLNSSTWDSQAAISCDGRQLFFASTRPGGIGGSDLYSSYRRDDGSWSEPVNLGAGVNTPLDEEAPFLSNDGETLYFSSMGHGGLGDQDIYFSRWNRQSERWSPAVNLGPPLNSPARELGFHLSAEGRTGFFASNRPGGAGGLDIYQFTLNEELTGREVTYVSGYVTDSLSGTPITEQEVVTGAGDVFRTNYAGRFFICAPPDQSLPLQVDHANYLPYARSFPIPAWDNRQPFRIDLRLTKPAAPRPPAPPPAPAAEPEKRDTQELRVLFAFESHELDAAATTALRQLLDGLDPDRISEVVISGYTDETGTNAYNLKLSERRAGAVARYLQEQGIPAELIRVSGRGEIPGGRDRRANRKVDLEIRMR
ncbi:OmpA family protein [Neolewinella marina]|uniref:OmpA family protein n=1 Tax=Neolewinella marina TaxID=438751 RepID=UPI0016516B77|nr:OmpA family protein [Neolewinella marina]